MRTEFMASKYLAKILAKEEKTLKEKYEEEKQQKEVGKPKALFKFTEWNKRKVDYAKSQKLSQIQAHQSQSPKALKETFIPFI